MFHVPRTQIISQLAEFIRQQRICRLLNKDIHKGNKESRRQEALKCISFNLIQNKYYHGNASPLLGSCPNVLVRKQTSKRSKTKNKTKRIKRLQLMHPSS